MLDSIRSSPVRVQLLPLASGRGLLFLLARHLALGMDLDQHTARSHLPARTVWSPDGSWLHQRWPRAAFPRIVQGSRDCPPSLLIVQGTALFPF